MANPVPNPTPNPTPAEDFLHKEYSTDRLLKISAEAPAVALDKTVQAGGHLLHTVPNSPGLKKAKAYWRMLGPGLTTGASDDDPSGIATYSQTGAQFGFGFLWMALWTFPLMSVVQEMCARIGLVTGRGLAGNIRAYYSRRVLRLCTLLLFAANAFNIGADLGAMAKGVQLLNPHLKFWWLVVGFTVLSLLLQIFTPYEKYARYLKWLALVLLSYVASSLLAHLDWGQALYHTLIPSIHFDKTTLLLVCAILGTTISPYLFFWQTSQEVEEQILQGKTTIRERRSATTPTEVKAMRIDVWSGMLLSNLVMFFIIAPSGGVLFPHGITQITSAAQAAEALKPFAGNATYFLFAIGIIGTGLLAIPVLAGSSSYAISEALGWREGLYRKLGHAYSFYGIIIISMLVGLGLNFIGLDPIKALIYSAIANGLVAPFILYFIVRISSNGRIMGHWRNRPATTFIGWLTTFVMAAAGIAAIVALL
jgi:NRAMP (natural resistance-associated macrophage protein)-like metal ion transporter